MANRKRRQGPPIHPSIKECLGYDVSETDDEVYEDWKERTSRVCKPCWELKYCPYGPLVEQLPLLPILRSSMEKQHANFIRCLQTNTVGEITPLTPKQREEHERWVDNDELLLLQAEYQLRLERKPERLDTLENEGEPMAERGGALPPVHIYRVPYNLGFGQELQKLEEADFSPDDWREIQDLAKQQKDALSKELETGEIDTRSPLESTRRVWYQNKVDKFSADDHPESIPPIFEDGCCSVFGHICPVFFAAEAMTETEQERRIGRRHLSFAKMMRIVRRDDYRCQHCQKQLQDNEVEFDHIIPVSKGGNSEEHNLRLTCYDCNRDKSDDYSP